MTYLKLIINNKNLKNNDDFFEKIELKKILNLYAQMVSNGIWKDYSFNITKNEISFNVYKRTSEFPEYKISKNLKPKNKNDKYLVKDKNDQMVKKSNNLENLINNFKWRKLKVINQN